MAHFEEELERKVLYTGRILTLMDHRVGLEDGGESSREVVHHHGGACVAALDGKGRLLLVRQYRFAAGRELLELPAGKLEAGEDPAEAAARELTEETGYRAGRLEKLAESLPTPAYSTEVIHLYLGRDLTPGEQRLDRDEFLDVVALPLEEALEKVLSGEISDSKTQVGILLLAARGRERGDSDEQ